MEQGSIDTLSELASRDVLYTIATGRTRQSAEPALVGHTFELPQAYKNGVVIWDPSEQRYTDHHFLPLTDVRKIAELTTECDLTPFVFAIEANNEHSVFHGPLNGPYDMLLAQDIRKRAALNFLPLELLSDRTRATNVSALGTPESIDALVSAVREIDHWVAYSNTAIEDGSLKWIDIHRAEASKGNAVLRLKRDLGASRVLCFGDSFNDSSMFEVADECYATSNAKRPLREAATAVIGHHDEDGVARFLRERYGL
ncbi:MAG: HAD-IIB family hydrolase [Myxococcota bacterium]